MIDKKCASMKFAMQNHGEHLYHFWTSFEAVLDFLFFLLSDCQLLLECLEALAEALMWAFESLEDLGRSGH